MESFERVGASKMKVITTTERYISKEQLMDELVREEAELSEVQKRIDGIKRRLAYFDGV